MMHHLRPAGSIQPFFSVERLYTQRAADTVVTVLPVTSYWLVDEPRCHEATYKFLFFDSSARRSETSCARTLTPYAALRQWG